MIDLVRTEQRFFVPKDSQAELLKKMSRILAEKKFSENPYAQTIYLGEDEFAYSWGTSLKARRYLPEAESNIQINPATPFNCEIKREETEGSLVRWKVKKILTLSQFIDWIKVKIPEAEKWGVRPYVLSQYHRRHFVNSEETLRLTADTEIKYGYFLSHEMSFFASFLWTGEEDGLRIEIKASEEVFKSSLYRQLLEVLRQAGALPVISKKEQAYNFHGNFIDTTKGCKPKKEIADSEIEAKFIVLANHYRFFLNDLKAAFSSGAFTGIGIASDYPYSQATTSMNQYWGRRLNGKLVDGVKLLFRPGNFSVVIKEQTEFLPNQYGLGCVLKRREIKGDVIPHVEETMTETLERYEEIFGPLELCGMVYRQRQAFWPETEKTGRIYHISLDRCISEGKILYQLEIEYVGRRPGDWQPATELEIVNEITNLAWEVYLWANQRKQVLVPTMLTKFEWLTSRS